MKLDALRKSIKALGNRSIVGMYGIRDHGHFNGPRWTHDHNAACFNPDGALEWYFELERLTKKKHDNDLEGQWRQTPLNFIIDDRDCIVANVTSFSGSSFVSNCNEFRVDCSQIDKKIKRPILGARGSVSSDPLNNIPAFSFSQELAHAFSAVAFSGLKLPALFVHADGAASVSSFSAFVITHDEVKCIRSDWSNVDAAMNFGYNDLFHEMLGQNEDERLATAGRLMGYAAHALGMYDEEMIEWLTKNQWFRTYWQNRESFHREALKKYEWQGSVTDLNDDFVKRIASCAQVYLERIMLNNLKKLKEKTGLDRLYAGGGIFLNIQLNKLIEDSKIFDEFYVAPNTSDTGLGLGAGLFLNWVKNEHLDVVSPYIQYDPLNHDIEPKVSFDYVDEIVDRLLKGQTLAMVVGKGEAGPRSLGHRAIICVPTKLAAQRVSMDIKKREWYRPVSPIGLYDHVKEFYEGDSSVSLLKYMLTVRTPKGLNEQWYGGVHVDNTSRLQVVDRSDKDNSLLIKILDELWTRHRIPFLINTSLNRSGEPIANSYDEARVVSKEIGLDGVIMNGVPEWFSDSSVKYPGCVK